MIEEILTKAAQMNASDVHLAGGKSPVFRILGKLQHTQMQVLSNHELDEIVARWQLSQFYATTIDINNPVYLFRMVTSQSADGVSIAIRLLHKHIQSLSDLHLPSELEGVSKHAAGLFLLAGATGSGKSTTAACMIELMLKRGIHLVSLENPIEYIFRSNTSCITQQEYGKHFTSFAVAAQHVMYQDPDVIYFGELTDLETIATALTLAETGHFVLGTIHAKGAAEAITRVIDIFDASRQNFVRSQLLSCLSGVFWQELIPGSSEQYPLYEMLQLTPAIASAISQGKPAISIRGELQNSIGCISRNKSAAELISLGIAVSDIRGYLTDAENKLLTIKR
jgi:twitching motility family protein